MNRIEEYQTLLAELDHMPPILEYTVTRARARVKRSKRAHRFFAIPVSSIAIFFAVFVFMVNASTTFALACGRIPLLRELAVAVAFSPSLSAAVENEYIQPINLEQTQNGITMQVEYVIADQKQLNIFFTLDSGIYKNMDATPSITNADGTALDGYSIFSNSYGIPNGELRHFTVDFVDRDMPGSLNFTCKVHDNGSDTLTAAVATEEDLPSKSEYAEPDFISAFTFILNFDPTFTQQGETINLNKTFMLDGQTITATTVEVYPTHIRLNLKDDKGNTAWLKSLMYYLEDENGKRFEQISNGITATGASDSPMMDSYRLESSFFAASKSLTLCITGAVWLDKNMERVRVNLASGTADVLPEGVTLEEVIQKGNSWQLTFTGLRRKENASYQLFTTDYYDEAGKKYSYSNWSSGVSSHWDEKAEKYSENPNVFRVQFELANYPYDTVYLSPDYSRSKTLDRPIVINVK